MTHRFLPRSAGAPGDAGLRRLIRTILSEAVEPFKFPAGYPKSWRGDPIDSVDSQIDAEIAVAARVPVPGSDAAAEIWDTGGTALRAFIEKWNFAANEHPQGKNRILYSSTSGSTSGSVPKERSKKTRQPPPDEPGLEPDEAMGQYLLPQERIGSAYAHVEEDPTPIEQKFVMALLGHYRSNNSREMAQIWPKIWKIAQEGLYSKWLQPPAGSIAYRGIGGVSASLASRIIGLSIKEIKEEPGIAHRVVGSSPVLRPRQPISSWTLRPTVGIVEQFTTSETDLGQCAILFAARCEPYGAGGGKFLMNPHNFTREFDTASDFAEEAEVIAHGPIEIEELSYIYYDDSDLRASSNASDARALLAALGL
jgi:hypothetical protein